MENKIRNFSKVSDFILVVIALWVIPELSIRCTDFFYPTFQIYDPNETFLYKTIHHLFQLVFTVVLMLILSRRMNLGQWGFNFKNLNKSIKWIVIFLVVFSLMKYFQIVNKESIQFDYPLTTTNKLGIQSFQYLLSGLGEEPLFRGFVMVFLSKYWNKIFKIQNLEVPVTMIFATILFMVAHVNIDILNLSISGFDFDQQMKALQLGILYGLAFHYTKSLLAPIVIHGLSNGIAYTIMFYFIN